MKEPTNRSHPIERCVNRDLRTAGLFCRISSLLLGSFAKETYNFKEPTHRSLEISCAVCRHRYVNYVVATISGLLKMTGLFCQRALQKRRNSAKETYDVKEPTNRSHTIVATDIDYIFVSFDHSMSIDDVISFVLLRRPPCPTFALPSQLLV